MLDMTESIAPKSDQLNADDLLAGPRTFTVTSVRKGGSDDQPIEIVLAEHKWPFRPSKTVRRVLVAAWGKDATTYVGKRMTLWCDPSVKWGGQAVGGIRVTHLSDIKAQIKLAMTVTRGKKEPVVIKPLEALPTPTTNGPAADQLKALTAAMTSNGMTDKDTWLGYLSQAVGRDVAATKELTKDEADLVLHELQNAPGGDQ